MAKVAYFDCFSGISGDMCLGALLGAGYPEEELRRQICRLGLPGVGLEVQPVKRCGLAAIHVRVACHQDSGDHPVHRRLIQIRTLLETSALDPAIVSQVLRVFEALARAEAGVHGCLPEEVHFHEVGAVDALVDVVGTVAGLDYLGVERVVCSVLPLGFGQVQTAHGLFPVPVPAVLELLRGPIPVCGGDLEGEFVTPTGAALMATLAHEFGSLPAMAVGAVGCGAGTMDPPDRPNILRLVIGEEVEAVRTGPAGYSPELLWVIETEIDDLNPEFFGPLIEKLLGEGALDVSVVPIMMKKGRPGQLLRVISTPEHRETLARAIFSETSTLGLRLRQETRWKLRRRVIEVLVGTEAGGDRGDPPGRAVAVKIGLDPVSGDVLTVSPEFEDCRRAAQELGRPLKNVYDQARELARATLARTVSNN